jgi:hypothetical protein
VIPDEVLAFVRQYFNDSRTAREFAAAAGWRCAACGRNVRTRRGYKPWTSLLPSWAPAHVSCVPSPSLHDLRETLGEPAHDLWLRSPFLPDLRAAP